MLPIDRWERDLHANLMLQRGEKCETKGMKAKVRANKGLMGREEREERVGGGTMLATR